MVMEAIDNPIVTFFHPETNCKLHDQFHIGHVWIRVDFDLVQYLMTYTCCGWLEVQLHIQSF